MESAEKLGELKVGEKIVNNLSMFGGRIKGIVKDLTI